MAATPHPVTPHSTRGNRLKQQLQPGPRPVTTFSSQTGCVPAGVHARSSSCPRRVPPRRVPPRPRRIPSRPRYPVAVVGLARNQQNEQNMVILVDDVLTMRSRNGRWVGWSVGRSVCRSVGRSVTLSVGWSVGRLDGRSVGLLDGRSIGRLDGRSVGRLPPARQRVQLFVVPAAGTCFMHADVTQRRLTDDADSTDRL